MRLQSSDYESFEYIMTSHDAIQKEEVPLLVDFTVHMDVLVA